MDWVGGKEVLYLINKFDLPTNYGLKAFSGSPLEQEQELTIHKSYFAKNSKGDLIIPSTAKRPKKWGNLEGTVEPSKLTVESTFTFLPSTQPPRG